MKNAVILLTKAPSIGVKTRIADESSPEYAQKVYELFLEKTSAIIKDYESFVYVEPPDKIGEIAGIVKADHYKAQSTGSLGERIISAVNSIIHQGYDNIVVIGGDSPTMPGKFIEKAFTLLADSDIVIGPTKDGGFYLLGCKKKLSNTLFANLAWGGNKVYEKIVENISSQGLSRSELPIWDDIDTLDDLKRSGLNIPDIKAI